LAAALIPAALATSCNQAARPAPAAPPQEAAPEEDPWGDDTSDTGEPSHEQAAPEPGGVDLPAASGSARNTGESDGPPPKADRGINDYRAIVQGNRDAFRACYEKSLGAHPGIKGRVSLVFLIDPKGNVKEARIDPAASDIHHKDLEDCMVAALKNLSFPPSRRGMESTIRYPFQFNPQTGSSTTKKK
jgi:TonB family protein